MSDDTLKYHRWTIQAFPGDKSSGHLPYQRCADCSALLVREIKPATSMIAIHQILWHILNEQHCGRGYEYEELDGYAQYIADVMNNQTVKDVLEQ